MKVTFKNLTSYQLRMPQPFNQLRLNAGAEGSLPWSFESFEFIRSLDKMAERGEIDVSFQSDRLEKYLKGYFAALVSMDGIVSPSGRTYKAHYATIQDAIDDLKGEAASDNRFVLELPPEDFEENVDLTDAEFIYLKGSVFGIEKGTKIRSSSGITLKIPSRNSGVESIQIESTSANPLDAAVQCVRSTTAAKHNETALKDVNISSPSGARTVWVDQIGAALPTDEDTLLMIYAGLEESGLGDMLYVDGGGAAAPGGVIWYLGGGGGVFGAATGPLHGVRLLGGGLCLCQSLGINADVSDPAAWAVQNEGGFFVALSGVTVDGTNFYHGGPGTTTVLREISAFGGAVATPVQLDAGAVALVSNVEIDGFGNPLGHGGTGWVVDATAMILPISPKLLFSTGTIPVGGAPDLRPSAVGIKPIGAMMFYATNGNRGGPGIVGTGCMLEWNPTLQQWEDPTGAVHP